MNKIANQNCHLYAIEAMILSFEVFFFFNLFGSCQMEHFVISVSAIDWVSIEKKKEEEIIQNNLVGGSISFVFFCYC